MDKNVIIKALTKGKKIFTEPKSLYTYDEIIIGTNIKGKTMKAVANNTFMAFGYPLNENAQKVKNVYEDYFIKKKADIIKELINVNTLNDMDNLERAIYNDIYSKLTDIKAEKLDSYNRIRKPINLYLEHIVSMCDSIDNAQRKKIVPHMFLPMDKFIFDSPHIFTDLEKKKWRIKEGSGFGVVRTEELFYEMQNSLIEKAKAVSELLQEDFYRIYFDIFWGNRIESEEGNLFLSNLNKNNEGKKHIANNSKSNSVIETKWGEEVRESQVINTILNFQKDKFIALYNKQSDNLKCIFQKLIEECSEFCNNHFDTNTDGGDYRLKEDLNYCLITFRKASIRIQVLTYKQPLASEEIDLYFNNKIHRGNGWYEFYISDLNQVKEAARLIKESKSIVCNMNS